MRPARLTSGGAHGVWVGISCEEQDRPGRSNTGCYIVNQYGWIGRRGRYGLWSMVASKTTLCGSAQFSDDSGAVCSFPRTWLIASMASHSEESVNGGPSSSVSYIDGITDGDIGGHGAVWGSIEADSYVLSTCG